MAQFIGSFTHTVDSQRRVAIPKQWRGSTPQALEFFLVPGHNQRIHVIPGDLFQRVWMPKLEQASMADEELSEALEAIGRQTHHTICDKQGRINLTPELMNFAGLTDQVVLNGVFSEFRLVSPAAIADSSQTFGTAMKHLQRLKDGD